MNKIGRALSSLFTILFILLFILGINAMDHNSLSEQAASLERAIHRSVVHCYCVEGTYPPSLEYLKEHYGITYDESKFYVDYIAIGSNLMPDITIIELSSDSILEMQE